MMKKVHKLAHIISVTRLATIETQDYGFNSQGTS